MFYFKKGDHNNLEGRVILYLKNRSENEFYAVRASIEFIESQETKVFTPIILTEDEILVPIYTLRIHAAPYEMNGEQQPLKEDCDVVCVGSFLIKNVQTLRAMLDSGIQLYSCFYANQQMFKKAETIGSSDEVSDESGDVPYSPEQTPDQVKNFVLGYGNSLYSFSIAEDQKSVDECEKALRNYFKNSPYVNDAETLIRVAKSMAGNAPDIISLYAEKISVLHMNSVQGYRDAADINRRIEQLILPNQKQ